jgi:hypothetical protein
MKKEDDMSKGRKLTRRGFAAAGIAGMGLIAAGEAGAGRIAANVSVKEAAHYVKFDRGKEK